MKSQPFFQYLNWHDLYDKKIKPPFVPTLLGDDDVSNFDPEFTLQPARLTPPGEGEEGQVGKGRGERGKKAEWQEGEGEGGGYFV